MIACGILYAVFIAIHFPYATDVPPSSADIAKTTAFYQQAYGASESSDPNAETYAKVAREAAEGAHVKDHVADFVAKHDLKNAKVLEVGAGQGDLQEVVADYTGLDISPSVKRFFTKPFVLGSATALPFPDNSFDAIWSIWVLEHIPNPEQALREMRRVLKNGGYLYLWPAWSCSSWRADGYDVRPYSDFGLGGMLVKASIPFRSSNLYHATYTAPIRLLRYAAYAAAGSPTTFHYSRLTPNLEKYWEGDSDAVASMDRYEALLWFASRGDECLNCKPPFDSILEHVTDPSLQIRVKK